MQQHQWLTDAPSLEDELHDGTLAVRTAGQAEVVPAGDQRDPGSGTPAAGRFVAALRRKPLTARRAALIIASYTVLVTFAGGFIASLADHKDFDSLGEGLWWALQTVTTVGYGDVVPSSGAWSSARRVSAGGSSGCGSPSTFSAR